METCGVDWNAENLRQERLRKERVARAKAVVKANSQPDWLSSRRFKVLMATLPVTGIVIALVVVVVQAMSTPTIDVSPLPEIPEPANTKPRLPFINAAHRSQVGTSLTVWFPESESGDRPLSYSIEGELPHGLIFDSEKRRITGTPSSDGSYPLVYVVTDSDGDSYSRDFKIEIIPVPTSNPEPEPKLESTKPSKLDLYNKCIKDVSSTSEGQKSTRAKIESACYQIVYG